MKFKIDENLPIEAAEVFIAAGHDAASVHDQALQGSQDADLAKKCAQEGRILVTLDIGFGDIRTYPPQAAPGFVVLRIRRHEKDYVLRALRRVVAATKSEALQHRLWIVEDTQIRIRGAEE